MNTTKKFIIQAIHAAQAKREEFTRKGQFQKAFGQLKIIGDLTIQLNKLP